MPGRSTVGQQTLDLLIGVRIPAGQPSVSEADRGDEKQGGEREKRVESKSLLGSQDGQHRNSALVIQLSYFFEKGWYSVDFSFKINYNL